MGTISAPADANVFMVEFEQNTFVNKRSEKQL